jgi:transcriptional regulator with XRE-family HTH domain
MYRIDGANTARQDGRAVAGEPDTRAETIGRRLRRLRVEQGISQRELSAPGISYAYISRIEAETRQPSVKALRMLARKLGVSPEYLETGSELAADEQRELRLAEQELRLRLEGEADTSETIAILGQAEADGDLAALVRARILLGFSASAQGDHQAAIAHLARVMESELVTPSSRPDVYATLGHAYAASGQAGQAVELFERALEQLTAAEPGNRAAEVRYATYLSYALTDLGDVARARAVLAALWAGSEQADDRYTRIRMYWSLGRVALGEAKPLAALDDFRRAVALLEATEDAAYLARAHVACAEAAIGSGAARDARFHLAEAERLLADHPGRGDLAAVRRLQALSALETDSADRAISLSEQAVELADGTPHEHALALAALAQARAADGDAGADDAFSSALTALARQGTPREHAELLRAYGRYLRDAAREREALDVFEQAAEIAAGLPGEPSSARH